MSTSTTNKPRYFGRSAFALIALLIAHKIIAPYSQNIYALLPPLFLSSAIVMISVGILTRDVKFTLSWMPASLVGPFCYRYFSSMELKREYSSTMTSGFSFIDSYTFKMLATFWVITALTLIILIYLERNRIKAFLKKITNRVGTTNLIFLSLIPIFAFLLLLISSDIYPMALVFLIPFITSTSSLLAMPAMLCTSMLFIAIGTGDKANLLIMLIGTLLALTIPPTYIALRRKLG